MADKDNTNQDINSKLATIIANQKNNYNSISELADNQKKLMDQGNRLSEKVVEISGQIDNLQETKEKVQQLYKVIHVGNGDEPLYTTIRINRELSESNAKAIRNMKRAYKTEKNIEKDSRLKLWGALAAAIVGGLFALVSTLIQLNVI